MKYSPSATALKIPQDKLDELYPENVSLSKLQPIGLEPDYRTQQQSHNR